MTSAESVYDNAADGGFTGRGAAAVANLRLVHSELAGAPNETMNDFQSGLVINHLHLVDGAVRWVQRRRSMPLDIEEAYGDGYEGLCLAATRFDTSRQVAFPTYASPIVRYAIIDGERRLHRLGGRDRQQATVVGLNNTTPTVSLDEPLFAGGNFTRHDVVAADDKSVDRQALDAISTGKFYADLSLSSRQRAVAFMKARKFTLLQIGTMLGVSERTVSRDFKTVVRAVYAEYYPEIPF